MKHGENCNCDACVGKRQSNGVNIGCSCGHCHNENNTQVEKEKGSFFSTYGITIFELMLSICLLLIGLLVEISPEFSLIFCILALLPCGVSIFIDLINNVLKGDFLSENTLMFIASIIAFVLGEYLEGVLIIDLFTIGELLEKIATDNTKKQIAGLSKLKIKTARLVSASGIEEKPCEEISVGSLIEVRKGDVVAIDGEIVGIGSCFDMKAITGESKYFNLKHGDKVYSGAINLGESVIIRTTTLYKDSTVEQIISMVQGATAKKAKSQRFITTFAKFYTPIVVVLALLIGIIPPIFNNQWKEWVFKGLTFLVVSCPCALVISVPLGFFIGLGSLSKKGILIKDSSYIDVLCDVKTFVCDKTGTLTHGNFVVQNVITFNGHDREYVLDCASAVEKSSSHPIARAINAYTNNKNLKAAKVNEYVGKGISGYVDNNFVIVGNKVLLVENGIDTDFDGVLVAINGVLAGKIEIADTVKENALECINKLKRLGITKTVMISGDEEIVCNSVAKTIGIDEYHSKLLPHQKTEKLSALLNNSNGKVMYVGDGINDAPSIAMADIGFSMGGLGSDLAIDSSDVVILDDDLDKISYSIKFARRIKRKVLQNIIGSIAVKVAIMIISVFVGIPIWLALVGDVGIMLLAVCNSLTNYIPIKY